MLHDTTTQSCRLLSAPLFARLTHIEFTFKPSQSALLVLRLGCFENGHQLVRGQKSGAAVGILQEGIVDEDVLLLGAGQQDGGGVVATTGRKSAR